MENTNKDRALYERDLEICRAIDEGFSTTAIMAKYKCGAKRVRDLREELRKLNQ